MRTGKWSRVLAWALGMAAGVLMGTGLAQAQSPAAPGPAPVSTPQSRLPVVASFSILADMAREVGGDDIDLSVIVGPLNDAHSFEPTPRNAADLGRAKVLIVNGLGFESWMPRLLQASGFKGDTIVASHGVQARELSEAEEHAHGNHEDEHGDRDENGHDGHEHDGHEHDGHEHGGHGHENVDPHAWQDLANGVIYVQNIAHGLAEADPAHASAYYARAADYVSKLRRADTKWRRALEAVPPANRVLVTSHDAFGYFGAAYGIRVLSVVGLSGEAEPSAREMADLIRTIREQHVRAIFLEQGTNSRALEQIAAETGVKPGGTLYADTLDRPGHEAATYLGMFRWNTQRILQAFAPS